MINIKETFENTIHSIRPHLSMMLCSEKYYLQILKAASQLPALSEGMLEIRLTGNEQQVDLGVLVVKKEMDLLLDFYNSNNKASQQINSSWKRILQFCKYCIRPNGFLGQNVSNIWVAYDLDTSKMPLPWIYIGLNPIKIFPELNADLSQEILKQYNINVTEAQNLVIVKLIKALPPSARFEAFGYLELRSLDVFRFISKPFNDLNEINIFLKQVNWPSDISLYSKLIESLASEAEVCQIVLDIGKFLLPKVGIEFWLSKTSNLDNSIIVLERLIADDLCKPQTRDSLLGWISKNTKEKKPDHYRWISHIKLTIEEKKPLSVKIYLSFRRK